MTDSWATYCAAVGQALDGVLCLSAPGGSNPIEVLTRELRAPTGTPGATRAVTLIGNGGLASVAAHMATDLWTQAGIRAHAVTDTAELTAAANDHGVEATFEQALERLRLDTRVLIAMSTSGQSRNILRALAWARDCNIRTVFLAGEALPPGDRDTVTILVPSRSTGHVQIAHLALLHAACDALATERAGARA